jgi:hypothetical protein
VVFIYEYSLRSTSCSDQLIEFINMDVCKDRIKVAVATDGAKGSYAIIRADNSYTEMLRHISRRIRDAATDTQPVHNFERSKHKYLN